MNKKKTLTYYFYQAGLFSIIAACFFIPFSTAFTSLFSGLTILFWVLSGQFTRLPETLKSSPVTLVATLLFLYFIIGLLYSPAELSDGLSNLKKYRELIYFPILVSFLQGNYKAQINAENAFVSGCIVLLLVSFGMSFSLIPSDRYGDSLVYHITHSFFMAILTFWAAHRTADSRQYRYFWLVVAIAALVNIGFIAPGRIGMLVIVFLAALFCIQRFSFKMQITGFLLVSTICGALYFSSNNISTRINEAVAEVQTYEPGSSRTSMGMRFDWYRDCLTLIDKRPVFGHGTGGFAVAHDELIKNSTTQPTDNPHNEYLFITTQLGLVGLFLFLLLLGMQLLCSVKLPKPDIWLLQGVVVSMGAGCLFNSFLYDSQQGHYFVFLTCIFIATSERSTLTFRR